MSFIHGRPSPLALYYFGSAADEIKAVRQNTTSGGLVINDVLMHYTTETLPFGGVGASGMGSYHGIDGFKRFSHARAPYSSSRASIPAPLSGRPSPASRTGSSTG
jgi:coniferyl-aldehyde dehydrogenase